MEMDPDPPAVRGQRRARFQRTWWLIAGPAVGLAFYVVLSLGDYIYLLAHRDSTSSPPSAAWVNSTPFGILVGALATIAFFTLQKLEEHGRVNDASSTASDEPAGPPE